MLAITVYGYTQYYAAAANPVWRPLHEIVLGAILIAIVLVLCRRVAGWPITLVVIVFFLYAIFSDYAPGVFEQRAIPWQRLVARLYLSGEGVYGSITRVSATFVFIFVLFGAMLDRSGAGEYFSKVAMAAFGGSRGGAAKVAVVASAVFAMISGSALANMASTGQFTIPLMIRSGYRREFAGGVEAVSSLGGEVTPPVMAGAVFIMMAILGVTYGTIVRAAILISALFYMSVYLSVHAEACKRGIGATPQEQLPPLRQTFVSGWYYFVPVLLLLSLLLIFDYPPERAGLFAVISVPAVLFFTKDRMRIGQILEGLKRAALLGSTIAILIICAQIITSLINFTGLGLTFSDRLLSYTGSGLLSISIVCFVTAVLLGMGLPATTAYVVLAIMIAPAMIKAGALPLAAHMFILYAAMNALITPPVAPGTMLTSTMAGADFLKTSWEAIRLAVSKFLLPFMFVFNPALLMIGSPLAIISTVARAAIMVWAAVVALQGWGTKPAFWYERVLFGAGSVMLIVPNARWDVAGATVLALAAAFHLLRGPARVLRGE